MQQPFKECRKPKIKYEGKILIIGVFLGAILGILWQDLFYHYHFFSDLKSCVDVNKIETIVNREFVSYINGTWSSSTGDVIITINHNENSKNFIIIENNNLENTTKTTYVIYKINDINGIMGVMNLDICYDGKMCNDETKIPIQINKIFGREKTIAISYDSRLTYCIDSDDQCTRAFKRLE